MNFGYPNNTADLLNTARVTLPVEILELIVDDLASGAHNDPSSLKALRTLALVSIALCRRAYKHLFSGLSLNLADNTSSDPKMSLSTSKRVTTSLYNLLFQGLGFPGIAMVYCIRTVHISFVFQGENSLQVLEEATFLPEFSGILDCLHGSNHGITCLKLVVDMTWPIRDIKFPIRISQKTNPQLFDAFISLCCSPNLTTLHLTNVAMDSKSLCGTNIRDLHLNNFSFEDDSEELVPQYSQSIHPSKTVLQPISLSLLNIKIPKPNPSVPPEIFTDLVWFFHPSPDIDIDKPLTLLPLVYAKLTHLTLNDSDKTTQIHLLPQLHTLTILQNIYLTRRMLYTSALPQFFTPLPSTGPRDLGSIHELIVRTKIHDPHLFFCPEGEDEPRLEDAWDAVDTHLSKALLVSETETETQSVLQHVQFKFILPAGSAEFSAVNAGRVAASGYVSIDSSSLKSYQSRFMTKFFPRLSSSEFSAMFSSDVSFLEGEVDSEKPNRCVVKCKGSGIGWW